MASNIPSAKLWKNSCFIVNWNFGFLLFIVFSIDYILSQTTRENELAYAKIGSLPFFRQPDMIQIYGEVVPFLPTQNNKDTETTHYEDISMHNRLPKSILQKIKPKPNLFFSTSEDKSANVISLDELKTRPANRIMFSYAPKQTHPSNYFSSSSSEEDLTTDETEIVVSIQPMPETNSQTHSPSPYPIKNIPIGQTLGKVTTPKHKTLVRRKGDIADPQPISQRGSSENAQPVSPEVAAPVQYVPQPPATQPARFVQVEPSQPAAVPSFQITFDPFSLILGLLQAIPIPFANLGGKAFFGVQLDKGVNFPGPAAGSPPHLQQPYTQRRLLPRLSSVIRYG